jgi:hypothetical protein
LVLPYLRDTLGVTSVGTVGTCWGSYVVVHTSTYNIVKAGLAAHPYHSELAELFVSEDEVDLYEQINRNQVRTTFPLTYIAIKPFNLIATVYIRAPSTTSPRSRTATTSNPVEWLSKRWMM